MDLNKIKGALASGKLEELKTLTRYHLNEIFNSSEFKRYWREQVGYNYKELEALVISKSPEQRKIAFWCIAGGAVANVMLAYLREEPAVINDIDVFIWVKGNLKPTERYFASSKVKFAGVERIGRFNLIYKEDQDLNEYSPDFPKKLRDERFLKLVSEFDYNACMAYFHPYSERETFISLPPFCQFIKEQKLKIYNFHHPLSTLIRGIKKEKELKVKFEKGKVVEVLANLFSEIQIEKTHLGESKKAEFSKHPEILNPWFTLNKEKNVFESVVKQESTISYNDKKYHEIFSFFRLPKKQREKILFLINHNFFSFRKIYHLVNSVTVSIPDFNEEQVKRLSPFMKDHGQGFNINPLYIREWLTLIKKIKKFNNLEFIGFCETLFSRDYEYQEINYYQTKKCYDFKELKTKFEEQINLENEEIISPLIIPEKFSEFIKELRTTRDLKIEGLELKHCVGGYSSAVKDGRSRIFKIRKNGHKATLELLIHCKEEKTFFEVNQLRGLQNSEADKEIVKLVNEFVKTLNQNNSK